jgi:phage shock protein A
MGIIKRVSRLFKADMHGILDILEEPEMILKQAVREMQEEIEKSENHLNFLLCQQARLNKIDQELATRIIDLQQQISFCLDKNELLAKSLLRKKLEAELQIKAVTQQLHELVAEHSQQASQLDERKEKLQATLDKAALFSEQHSNADINEQMSVGAGFMARAVTQEDVELAFLHEKQHHALPTEQSTQGERP